MSEVGRIRISSKAGVKVHFENPGQEGGDAATLCGQGADYISPTTDAADCARCVKAHVKLVAAAADEVIVAAGLARNAVKAATATQREERTGIDELKSLLTLDMTDVDAAPATMAPLPVRKRAHAAHDAYLASIVIMWTCGTCGPRDRMGCGACIPADEKGFPIIDLATLAQRWMDLFTSVANHPDVDVARSESWQYRQAFSLAATAIDNAYTYVDMDDIMALVAQEGVTVAEAAKRVYEAEFPLMCQEQTHTPCEYRTDTVDAMRYHVQRAHGDDTSALWLDTLTSMLPDMAAEARDLSATLAPWEIELLQADQPVTVSKIIEALPPTGSRHGDHIRDYAIGYVPQYRGHWSGTAWVSHHGYGLQMHMTLADARNWAAGRVAAEGRSDLVAAPIPPMVLTRRKASKGRGNRGWRGAR